MEDFQILIMVLLPPALATWDAYALRQKGIKMNPWIVGPAYFLANVGWGIVLGPLAAIISMGGSSTSWLFFELIPIYWGLPLCIYFLIRNKIIRKAKN